jgi:Tfp pilus assembly protein PilF
MVRRKRLRTTRREDQQRSSERTRRNWERLLPIVVVLAGGAAYLNSFSGAFLFDETKDILNNPRIRHVWPLSETMAGRRPVVDATLAVNYSVSELEVEGYHLTNLAIHLLAAVTLFGLIRRTVLRGGFGESAAANQQAASRLALVISLLWVIHPLQTQSVDYIIQRCESMMGLFYLLVLYCVTRGTDSRRRIWWYGGAVVACAAGMGSKAVMVTAPVVVLLYDRTFVSGSFIGALRRRPGLYLGLAATWSVLVLCGVAKGVFNLSAGREATVGFGVKDITPIGYLLTQPGVILHYLRLALCPNPLCLDHGWPLATDGTAALVPGMIVLLLLAGTAWALWRNTWTGFVGAWFFIILAPTSSFIPLKDPLFEHRMYLPLAAVVTLVVIGGDAAMRYLGARRIARRVSRPGAWRRFSTRKRAKIIIALPSAILVCAAVIVLGAGTADRNKDYRSDVGMWRDVVAKRPRNARGHNNLGVLLDQRGRLDEAVRAYTQSVRLDPSDATAYTNLGQTLTRQGRLDEALAALRQAVQITPRYAKPYDTMGNVYIRQGRTKEAIKSFRRAIDLNPRLARAHYNLGTALSSVGWSDQAIAHFREALRLSPRYPDALVNLGLALQARGQNDEALEKFQEALRIQPDHAEARRARDALVR